MTVPAELTGAWRRAGLLVGGLRVHDPCEVLWLQTEEWYADIRVPRPGPAAAGVPPAFAAAWAFAGTANWDPPIMTWAHHLDLHPEPAADSNELRWEGDLLVERGRTEVDGRPVDFAEEWERLDAGDGAEAGSGPGWARVQVGAMAVEVRDARPSGPFGATRLERSGEVWRVTGTVEGA